MRKHGETGWGTCLCHVHLLTVTIFPSLEQREAATGCGALVQVACRKPIWQLCVVRSDGVGLLSSEESAGSEEVCALCRSPFVSARAKFEGCHRVLSYWWQEEG